MHYETIRNHKAFKRRPSGQAGRIPKAIEDLKMTHAISPLENPLQIKTARRVVARLQTALSNQEA